MNEGDFGLGSRDPKNRALGPKCHNIYGLWALRPCYLGPLMLKVVLGSRIGGFGFRVWSLGFRAEGLG